MKAFGRLVFPRIDKEGDDGLFAKRLGGLQTDVVFAHDGTVARSLVMPFTCSSALLVKSPITLRGRSPVP